MTTYLTHFTPKRFLNDENTNDIRTGQDLASRELLLYTTEGAL